jgi:hypothetical protein
MISDAPNALKAIWTQDHDNQLNSLRQKFIPKDLNKDDSAPFLHSNSGLDDAIKRLKGISWHHIALALVNWTANTMEQRALASRIISTAFDDLSRYKQIHSLKQFLDIMTVTGQLSIGESLEHSVTLDELHQVCAKDKGLDFNAGDRPSAEKSSIISGSFCTITNDLTKQQALVALYAFTPYTIDLIEEVLHHAATTKELKKTCVK